MKSPIIQALLLFIFIALASGLTNSEPSSVDFGGDYQIINNSISPLLIGDSVAISIRYSACSDDQTFELHSRTVQDDQAQIWIFWNASQPNCDRQHRKELAFTLPKNILASNSIVLLTPDNKEIKIR